MARATHLDHLDPIRNIRNIKKTPGWVISEETAVLMGLLLGYQGDTTFSGFLVARVTNWDHLVPGELVELQIPQIPDKETYPKDVT